MDSKSVKYDSGGDGEEAGAKSTKYSSVPHANFYN